MSYILWNNREECSTYDFEIVLEANGSGIHNEDGRISPIRNCAETREYVGSSFLSKPSINWIHLQKVKKKSRSYSFSRSNLSTEEYQSVCKSTVLSGQSSAAAPEPK
jgi:hypothetical protein